jgi:hypothetical protein
MSVVVLDASVLAKWFKTEGVARLAPRRRI